MLDGGATVSGTLCYPISQKLLALLALWNVLLSRFTLEPFEGTNGRSSHVVVQGGRAVLG